LDGAPLARPDPKCGPSAPAVTEAPANSGILLGLVELFRASLGVASFGATDNFFDRGGNSLLAVVLVGEIEQQFSATIPLPKFFERPTPQAVAEAMQRRAPARVDFDTHVFRSGGDRAPLFFICGIEIYHALADRLSPRHAAYALFVEKEVTLLKSQETDEPEQSSVEELANEYFERVIAVRPHGPYALVGLSFGGLLALRVAEMLRERNETVELLTLLDTLPPTLLKLNPLQRASFISQRVLREGPGYLVPKLKKTLEHQFKSALPNPQDLELEGPSSRVARTLEDTRECLYSDMGSRFLPKPYPGRVALIISVERDRSSVTANAVERYWRRHVVGTLKAVRVAGGHVSMLKSPFVDEVARQIQDILDAPQR
jgi:thioesterase domain-containing protein/acyl carrier protein